MATDAPQTVPADFQSLCALARLRLPAAQQAELARRLEAVLGAFASLAAAEPLPAGDGHLQDAAPMRPDVVDAVLAPSTVLANSQHVAADCFVVPRVVEG